MIVLVFCLCAANYTAHTIRSFQIVATDSVTGHDAIVTDDAERIQLTDTMGSQIGSCLKAGKSMVETIKELGIRPQLAWAVYLQGRENIKVSNSANL